MLKAIHLLLEQTDSLEERDDVMQRNSTRESPNARSQQPEMHMNGRQLLEVRRDRELCQARAMVNW